MKRSSLRLSSCSNSPSSSSPKKETITKKGKKIFLSEDDDSLTFLSSSWDQMWTVEGDGFIFVYRGIKPLYLRNVKH